MNAKNNRIIGVHCDGCDQDGKDCAPYFVDGVATLYCEICEALLSIIGPDGAKEWHAAKVFTKGGVLNFGNWRETTFEHFLNETEAKHYHQPGSAFVLLSQGIVFTPECQFVSDLHHAA